jgi:hypothetical protein
MSLDMFLAIAWVEEHIFIPAWSWINFDTGGFTILDYALAIGLAGFAGIWIVKRFKNVYHSRYDDYFDMGNERVEAELHGMAGKIERHLGFTGLPFLGDKYGGFGETFDAGAQFDKIDELYQETEITDLLDDELEKISMSKKYSQLFGSAGSSHSRSFDNPRSTKRIRYEQREGSQSWENEYDTIEFDVDYGGL